MDISIGGKGVNQYNYVGIGIIVNHYLFHWSTLLCQSNRCLFPFPPALSLDRRVAAAAAPTAGLLFLSLICAPPLRTTQNYKSIPQQENQQINFLIIQTHAHHHYLCH